MIIIGIDPGSKGAIAVMSDGNIQALYPFPVTAAGLDIVLKEYPGAWVFAEAPASQRFVVYVRKAFLYCGQIRGICCAYNLPLYEVPSKEWKKTVLAGKPYEKNKAISVEYATCKYPDWSASILDRKTFTDNTGPADAICLAEYGFLKLKGEVIYEGKK